VFLATVLWLLGSPGAPISLGTGAAYATNAFCTADCNQDGVVEINELVRAVNIALGSTPLAQCERARREATGLVTISDLVSGVTKVLEGCPLLNVALRIHNTSAATVTLSGQRLDGPSLGLREKDQYTKDLSNVSASCGGYSLDTPCPCPATGTNPCLIEDLAPGRWVHRICVDPGGGNCSDVSRQYQARQALFAEDPSMPATIEWTVFRTILNVTTTSDSLSGSLRAALTSAASAAAPALVQFRRDVFPAGSLQTISATSSSLLKLKGDWMELDGTDANGNPSPVAPWSARLFYREVALSSSGSPSGGALAFGSGSADPVRNARIVGLAIRRALGGATTDQDLVIFRGGTASRQNVVDTGRLDGGASTLTSGASGIDCVDAMDTSLIAAEANVVRNSELRYCRDRGVKIDRGFVRVEESWVHHNLRGGIFVMNGLCTPADPCPAGAGMVASLNNLIERNGRNLSGQVTFDSARELVAEDNGVASRQMEVTSDGDLIRGGVEGGIALREYAKTAVTNAFVCGMTGQQDAQLTGGQGIQATVMQGNVEIKVRGSTAVYNNRNGVSLAGQGHANIDFGRVPAQPNGIGNNAFTMNSTVAPTPGPNTPRNFKNATNVAVVARHNQWQRCGTGASCAAIGSDLDGTIEFDPPQPQRSTDPSLYPFQINKVSPLRVRPGQLLRITGSGFNAIEGFPFAGNCDTTAQDNNLCEPLSGTCVQVELSPGNWQPLHTVQAVTPTMITAKWPNTGFPCDGPMKMRVRRPNPPGSSEPFREFSVRSPVVCINDQPVPE
jgi:hypothetical protein